MKAKEPPIDLNHGSDRWMYAVATLAFIAMVAGGFWWLQSINFFYFKATFPVGEFGSFLVCMLIIVANIAMRIPALLRWLRALASAARR